MRTTYAAVKKLVETDTTIIAADADLDPFIEMAGALVDDVCVPLTYSDTRLEQIERWLSAHFYSIRDKQRASEGVDGLNERYDGQTGMHLEATLHGQQAMLLDTKGGLAGLQRSMTTTRKSKIGMHYLGTVPE